MLTIDRKRKRNRKTQQKKAHFLRKITKNRNIVFWLQNPKSPKCLNLAKNDPTNFRAIARQIGRFFFHLRKYKTGILQKYRQKKGGGNGCMDKFSLLARTRLLNCDQLQKYYINLGQTDSSTGNAQHDLCMYVASLRCGAQQK